MKSNAQQAKEIGTRAAFEAATNYGVSTSFFAENTAISAAYDFLATSDRRLFRQADAHFAAYCAVCAIYPIPLSSYPRSLKQAHQLLDLVSLLLPRKITSECFGDLAEELEEMAESAPGWRLQLKVLIRIGWASLFTLREIAKPGALLAAIWKLIFG